VSILENSTNLRAFRRDIEQDAENGFNRNLQLQMCARQLEALREAVGPRWAKLVTQQKRSDGQAELKLFVKDLIRKSSESTDFYATVDFITKDAFEVIEEQRRNHPFERSLRKHLTNWGKLSHEHMVPGDVIYRTLINSPCRDLLGLLEPLSYRALVSGSKRQKKSSVAGVTDIQKLDLKYRSIVPEPREIREFSQFELRNSPLKFWGLIRYDVAGLLENLIYISSRAEKTLREYKLCKLVGTFQLPDYTFDTLGNIESRFDYGV
jgi:hypothetical protein